MIMAKRRLLFIQALPRTPEGEGAVDWTWPGWRIPRRPLTLAICAGLVGTVVGAPASRAAGEVASNATGRVVAVAPISGGLSLEVGLGSAIADLKGTTPRAEAATLKPGILGLLLGSTLPLPAPAKADLRSVKQVDRTSVVPELGLGGVAFKATRERAQVMSAEDDGGLSATARTDLTNLEVAGLVEVSGGTARSVANAKLAEGSSAIGRITVKVGGTTLVDLQGLEWRVVSELGEKPHATFSIGSATIQGDRQAIDSPAELATALEPLAPVFAPAGLAIRVPGVKELSGGAALSPLVIESVNATALRSTVGAIYPEIAPVYNEIATQLQGQAAEAGLALLVANVGVSVAAGNGGARISLGGASAAIASRAALGGDDGTESPDAASLPSGDELASAASTGALADTGATFFTDDPPARIDPGFDLGVSDGGGRQPSAATASTSPVGPRTGSSRSAAALSPLATTPIADDDGATIPATLVLAIVLAAVTALAARDQMNTGRRAALRHARARTAGSA